MDRSTRFQSQSSVITHQVTYDLYHETKQVSRQSNSLHKHKSLGLLQCYKQSVCPVKYLITTLEQNTNYNLFHPYPSKNHITYYVAFSPMYLLKEVQACLIFLGESFQCAVILTIRSSLLSNISLQFKFITSHPVCYEHSKLMTFSEVLFLFYDCHHISIKIFLI